MRALRVVRVRLLTLAAVIAVPAFAQNIYTWEDEVGIYYTDDASKLPKHVKVEGRVAESSPMTKGLSSTAMAVAPSPAAASTEFEWRDAFIAAHRRIATVRRSISALEATLPPRTECVPQPIAIDGTQQSRGQRARCQLNPLHDQLVVQIAQEQVQLKNAELDLEQLDRRASMQSVPREWRRGW